MSICCKLQIVTDTFASSVTKETQEIKNANVLEGQYLRQIYELLEQGKGRVDRCSTNSNLVK